MDKTKEIMLKELDALTIKVDKFKEELFKETEEIIDALRDYNKTYYERIPYSLEKNFTYLIRKLTTISKRKTLKTTIMAKEYWQDDRYIRSRKVGLNDRGIGVERNHSNRLNEITPDIDDGINLVSAKEVYNLSLFQRIIEDNSLLAEITQEIKRENLKTWLEFTTRLKEEFNKGINIIDLFRFERNKKIGIESEYGDKIEIEILLNNYVNIGNTDIIYNDGSLEKIKETSLSRFFYYVRYAVEYALEKDQVVKRKEKFKEQIEFTDLSSIVSFLKSKEEIISNIKVFTNELANFQENDFEKFISNLVKPYKALDNL